MNYYEEYKAAAIQLFNSYRNEYIDSIQSEGILYERQLGLSRDLIEYSRDVFQNLYDQNGIPVILENACFLNGGDTLYAFYDKNRFSRSDALELIRKRYNSEASSL